MPGNTVNIYRNSSTCKFLQFEIDAPKIMLDLNSSIHKTNHQEMSL